MEVCIFGCASPHKQADTQCGGYTILTVFRTCRFRSAAAVANRGVLEGTEGTFTESDRSDWRSRRPRRSHRLDDAAN